MCECVCVCVCARPRGHKCELVCVCGVCVLRVRARGWQVREWMAGDECVPVGACLDLGIDSQLLHHGVRHEGEKGGNDCLWISV